MAEKRIIKERIQATEKTYQITNAMNMVSTSKLRKTEKQLMAFRPISDSIKEIMSSLLSSGQYIQNKAFEENKAIPCYILISSDRGLIGSYNNAVFKYFDDYISTHHKSYSEFKVATIGYKAFSYAKSKKYPLLNQESANNRDDVLFVDFEEVSEGVLSGYLDGTLGKTTIFYTSFVNTLTNKIIETQLLPIEVTIKEDTTKSLFVYEPNRKDVLDTLVKIYVSYTLYRIILEAKTSEHASRMNAMKNASDNAKDIEEKLTLLYNHARQNQITTELTDIINGSNAVK